MKITILLFWFEAVKGFFCALHVPFLQAYLESFSETSANPYCLFGVKKYIYFLFSFLPDFGMLSKGMGESFLLSEDEPLTPNIDGVMAL